MRSCLLALAAALVCACGGERSGDRPPVESDFESLQSVCRSLTAEVDQDREGWSTLSEKGIDRIAKWLSARATPRFAEEIERLRLERSSRFLSCYWATRFNERKGRAIWPVTSAREGMQAAVIPVETESLTWTGSVQDPPLTSAVHLRYQQIAGEWRIDGFPDHIVREADVELPVAKHAERMPEFPDASPIIWIHHYAPGEIPDDLYVPFDEEQLALFKGSGLQAVIWKGRWLIYPGKDSKGRTDPYSHPHFDLAWELQDTAADLWLPFLQMEEDAASGRLLPSDSYTLVADQDVDAAMMRMVLRTMVRENVLMRKVRLEVMARADDPAPSVLHLSQALGWEEEQASPIVKTGRPHAALRAELGSPPPARVGVRMGEADRWKDVVATLDALRGMGVQELFIAVLPEGYEPLR